MDAIDLLNGWQRDFPRVAEPFVPVADSLGLDVPELLARWQALQSGGALSRVGGVFAAQAGGAALLSALQVPEARLEAVADRVSAHPGVNHNYRREHAWNLWFVMTGADAVAVEAAMVELEADTGLRALRLPMLRPYRIDLGFDLRAAHAAAGGALDAEQPVPAVAASDRPLAACVEAGLPLVPRPYDVWAARTGRPLDEVLDTLDTWLAQGTLRRFGAIVRHHEFGVRANAMTVFDVPDAAVDACGLALARQPGVTLAYQRARDAGWHYNLYCMVHGRDREAVRALIDQATQAAGLGDVPREILFSNHRYKQTGARRFSSRPAAPSHHAWMPDPHRREPRDVHHLG